MNRVRIIPIIGSALILCACGGDGNSGRDRQIDPPGPPTVSVSADFKQLDFSWDVVANADYYRLLRNPDGHSGFTQIGNNIPAGTLSVTLPIPVHLHDWVNALYSVQACNSAGCTGSVEVSATDLMLDTIGYFKASNNEPCPPEELPRWYCGDTFGSSVALSADGQTMAVGADREDSNATGVDGDQSDNSAEYAGAMYLFRQEGGTWRQQAYIKASDTEPRDRFGRIVALSADGKTLAVGAPGAAGAPSEGHGAIYVFHFDGSDWIQQAHIQEGTIAEECRRPGRTERGYIGEYIGLNSSGDTLVIAFYDIGLDQLSVYRFDGVEWRKEGHSCSTANWSYDYYSTTVTFSADANTVAIGAPESNVHGLEGAVIIYRFDGTDWYEQAFFQGSNTEWGVKREGCIGSDPDFPDEDCFGDKFGISVSLSADGNALAVGAYHEDGGATSINGDDQDNSAPSRGAAYLFRSVDGVWEQQAYIKPSNTIATEHFGSDVVLSPDGNTLVVGALGADDPSGSFWMAYTFRFDGQDWSEVSHITQPTLELPHLLGLAAISFDGKTLAISAPYEDSAATGINGDRNDNSSENSGAVFVY